MSWTKVLTSVKTSVQRVVEGQKETFPLTGWSPAVLLSSAAHNLWNILIVRRPSSKEISFFER